MSITLEEVFKSREAIPTTPLTTPALNENFSLEDYLYEDYYKARIQSSVVSVTVATITVPTIAGLRSLITVSIGKHTFIALIDSRYDISFIDNKVVKVKGLLYKEKKTSL